MSVRYYLACDLGAESGRVMLGRLEQGRVALEEIHRFATGAVRLGDSLRWDILRLWDDIRTGLRKALARGVAVESVSVDSWGLDYVLSGDGQELLSAPFHYRDSRSEVHFERAQEHPGTECIFNETGIQMMPINMLYQLAAEQERSPRLLVLAERFLNIADFVHFLLSGVARAEESLASTTQIYNPATRDWSERLIREFGFPRHIFPQIVPSGTVLGPLRTNLAEELGVAADAPLQVVATCSHDTGAAVAAVPAEPGDHWAYLSSGTWSLLGVELSAPRLDAAARGMNFTNEAGYGGTTRFLKNIVGLWLLQELRRSWAEQGQVYDYAQLSREAEQAPAFGPLIHPGDVRFSKPGGMPDKIASYCREQGVDAPVTVGATVRCVYESLALQYRRTLEEVEAVTGRRITRLHIVGGGSQSAFFNQCIADATGREVFAGPVEATAVGNVLLQAVALGHLESLQALRDTVRRSFEQQCYVPRRREEWAAAFARFTKLGVAG
jgi:rhamnulokinase